MAEPTPIQSTTMIAALINTLGEHGWKVRPIDLLDSRILDKIERIATPLTPNH